MVRTIITINGITDNGGRSRIRIGSRARIPNGSTNIRTGAAAPRPENQYGAYDTQHQWHDSNWWHQNNPRWFWTTHSERASNHPEWRDQDGYYDQQHTWHYGQQQPDQSPDYSQGSQRDYNNNQ
jgi:hypothetical protein